MTDWIRRLRGALGIATVWGAIFGTIGLVLALVIGVFRPDEIDAGEGAGKVALVLGLAGFLSGLGFAGLLWWSEKGHRIHELALGRVALYGAIGGAAIPALLGAEIGEGWITGALGGLLAAGSVAVARRGALLPENLHASGRTPEGEATLAVGAGSPE